MNRSPLIALILSLIYCWADAQKINTDIVNGDLAFEKFKYEEAVVFYKAALTEGSNDTDIKLKIAESYRKMNDHSSAVEWYGQVLDDQHKDFEDIFKLHYAQALLYVDDKENARKWFLEYRKKDSLSRVPENRLEGIDNFESFLKKSKYYTIEKLGLNSPSKDFSPHFYRDGLIFVSDRTTNEGKNAWDSRVFLNLFHARLSENGTFYTPEELSSKLNTLYHEGPVSIYNDGKRIAFTRNNYHKKVLKRSSDGINNLQIFFADINEKDKWTNLEKFEHNSHEYSIGHPAMNTQGNLMIFSSDMPGGLGGSDIYFSELIDGRWTSPKNVGNQVNTQGDELFPFLYQDSILYFSSNGHYGLGGLDVYRTSFSKEQTKPIENMGTPINSNADDFGFIVHKKGNMGYFSSNRESYENDDIYRFRIIPVGVKVAVVDRMTQQDLTVANVVISMGDKKEELSYYGEPLRYRAAYDQRYEVSVMAEGYGPGKATFNTTGMEPGQLTDLVINMPRIVQEMPVSTTKLEPDVRPLAKIDAVEHLELVNIGGETYIGVDGKLYKPEEMDISEDSLNIMKRNMPDLPEAIEIKNIYYDHDKFDLKTQATRTIDGIVKLMERYESAVLEIASHTDSNGSSAYNERLAQDRSDRVVAYLTSLNVDESRLRATSYGETRPVNKCRDGVPCSPEEHQMNRRTEFILKF